MAAVAATSGLARLTTEWSGAKANYRFRRLNWHEFERLGTAVLYKRATRCPECEGEVQRERLMEIVRRRGGELVEGEFTTVVRRYRLRCGKGHEWTTLGQHIVAGHWCRRCATDVNSERLLDQEGLARLQAAARDKGGRCLATKYIGRGEVYELECSYGHRWQTKGGFILDGHCCPRCAIERNAEQQHRSDGLQRLQAAAASRGGVCLNEHYAGGMSRYRFRCAAGHEWQSFAGAIVGGAWCTECRFDEAGEVALERLCAVAKALDWKCLSGAWKGYNKWYEFECAKGHRFARHATALLYRGDQARCEVCEEEGIEARWLKAIVTRRGEFLNGPFRGLSERYSLRCADGHEWETAGELIRRGKWCPDCGRAKSTQSNILADGLARLQASAREHRRQCLAEKHTRSCDAYPFECSKGHRWKSTGQMVLYGHWCPKCAAIGRRLTLDTMQAIAKERGGLCLSTEYRDAHTKLTWQCHGAHVWHSSASNIKNKGVGVPAVRSCK